MKLKDYEYFSTDLGVLYHCDWRKILHLIKIKIDELLYIDPPYKISASGGGFFNRTKRKYIEDIKNNIGVNFNPDELLNVIKDRFNNVYVWSSKDLIHKYINFAIENKYNYNLLHWHKINPMPINNNTYLPDTEYCIFLRKNKPYFNSSLPQKYYRKYILTAVGKNNHGHPTEKPEKVIINHIKISTPAGGIVMDLYGGSGTTGAVSEKLGLNWILFEKEKKYCEIIKNRIKKISKIEYKDETIKADQFKMEFNK